MKPARNVCLSGTQVEFETDLFWVKILCNLANQRKILFTLEVTFFESSLLLLKMFVLMISMSFESRSLGGQKLGHEAKLKKNFVNSLEVTVLK